MVVTLFPMTGSFRGGTPVQAVGPELDMTPCQDDFASGISGALWTTLAVGGATVTAVPAGRLVEVDTSTTPGSSGGLQTLENVTDVDAEVQFQLQAATLVDPASRLTLAEIALVAGASTVVVSVTLLRGIRRLNIAATDNGVTVANLETSLTNVTEVGTETRLRLLRAGALVVVFRDQEEVLRFLWGTANAQFRFVARNDLTLANSRVVSRILRYTRRPVVRFGTVPATDYLPRGTTRGALSTPAVACDVDAVPVTTTGCNLAETTTPNGFTFTRAEDLTRFVSGSSRLTICNDARLTRRSSS